MGFLIDVKFSPASSLQLESKRLASAMRREGRRNFFMRNMTLIRAKSYYLKPLMM